MATQVNLTSGILSVYKEILSLIQTNVIKPPEKYHEQVIVVKDSLKNDESGIVNTVLDYAIECAARVTYKVETDNDNLTEIYNTWLKDINSSLRRKKVEVGVNGLAKQYFMEMLKGSSHALLRTIYKDKKVGTDGSKMNLPNLMWFADGKDIYIKKSKSKAKIIGSEKYKLKIGKGSTKDDFINLPTLDNEEIFVQTPFEAWGTLLPIPFLIRRGIWKNMKVMGLISDQGEGVVRKALKYLLVILKGTDKTYEKQGQYGREALLKTKDGFKNFLNDLGTETGVPTLVTNHDTQIDHLIPDFNKVVNQELQDPSRQKILQGLGLIEIIQGTGSQSRKESIINPKPFIKLVNALINDYCDLLTDVLEVTREKNTQNTKYNSVSIKVKASAVPDFVSMEDKELMRTIFDRGVMDYESLCETVGIDYNLVVSRSKKQLENGIDSILYPHIILNQEQYTSEAEIKRGGKPLDKPFKDDRNGTGRQNFVQASRECALYNAKKPLPKSVKKLPVDLQKVWKTTYNKKFIKTGSEAESHRLAWGIISRIKRLRLKQSGE